MNYQALAFDTPIQDHQNKSNIRRVKYNSQYKHSCILLQDIKENISVPYPFPKHYSLLG